MVLRRNVLKGLGALGLSSVDLTSAGLRPGALGPGALAPLTPAAAQDGGPMTFERLREEARRLAAQDYRPAPDDLPPVLADLSYDDYQAIRFRPEAELVFGDRFSAQLFHRGFLHRRRVHLFVQGRDGPPRPVAYRPELFDLGRLSASRAALSPDLGFAGWRLHYAFAGVGAPRVEFAVFLGASYFRLVGAGQEYGLSGRAVAVDTGLDRPEEFPAFTAFWLSEPEPGSATMTVLALIDGPSLAGACRFRIGPGRTSVIDTEVSLHPRKPIERLGLAPLTSMFLHGENGPDFDDFRPEVHDSDGLLLQTDEGWTWRPLVNGRDRPLVTRHPTGSLRGFGLLQRDRAYASYLDVQARHESRPGLWIEPRGEPWPGGSIHLYEINSREEYMDNIVAFWVPPEPVGAGRPLEFAYRVSTVAEEPRPAHLGRVVRTRLGGADRLRPLPLPVPERRYYVVDFEGSGLPDGNAPVGADVRANRGAIVEPFVERVPQTGEWRVYFEHRPMAGTEPLELSARLVLDGRPLTETWRYNP